MGAHRWARYLTVLLVVALVTPLVGVPTAFAASSFTGGPTDTVLYVPNDHTPIAFRFRATAGLAPSTQYYVKVRFTVGTSPNPTTNRGFTWNGTTGTWVPDLGGGNWTDYPVVTSNSDGTITEQWIFAKFGDELSSGTYHVMISLFANGTTYNSSDVPAVTVMDMATEGGWIHNGTTIAAGSAGKRVECSSVASTATVYALAKTELDTVDSDSDGTVDNEDYGPAGVSAADFRLGVPVGMPFNTYINRTTQIMTGFTLAVADTDIAHSAADQVAPSAPGSFAVKSGVLANELSWTTASDAGGSGLASYRIVRRVATETVGFSNPWQLIATPAADATSYTDSDVEVGVQYFYEIRAVDTATNVGPRATGSGTPVSGLPLAGGPTDTVLYVPNDHTPIGFRFKATSGLAPSTQYNVMVRFTVGTSSDPATDRGMTWNGASGEWVPTTGGDNWGDFPVVTSNADGSITEQWIFAKFADELSSGGYHVMVSLFDGVTTFDLPDTPAVTVMDMATQGGWIHNGTTISSGSAGKRVECSSVASTATVYALAKTELDTVDSDSDGTIDNEDYGPAGVSAADFRLGVPVSLPFNTYINRTTQIMTSFTLAVADTDIAHNVADQTAPTAVGSFSVEPGVWANELAWTASSDSGGSGMAHYRIVRRVASDNEGFSNPWELIATPAPDATSYTDDDLEPGIEYFYEIRAVDVATNVGPRASGSGTPLPVPPVTIRTSGADRYATAIAISESTFPPDSVSTAVLATGMNFPDALAASGLAGAVGSPVLLVGASVTASLTAELDRLGVTDVVIVGGESAVSTSVATALAANYTVDRIAGSDRYTTAAYVASRIKELTGDASFAFFARGDSFADALAVSPIAYSGAIPVLLVRPSSVPTITSGAIGVLGVTDGVVAGSEAAVSSGVYATLDGLLSGTIQRVGGANRYDTAKLVAEYAVTEGWATYSYIGIATGLNYPDALGGCAATAWSGGVLLLTDPKTLSAPVASVITDNKADIGMVEIFGGTSAVSQGVFNAVEALLN